MRKKFQQHSPLLQSPFPAGYHPQVLCKKHPLRNTLRAASYWPCFHFLTLPLAGRKRKQAQLKLLKHLDTLLAVIAITLMLLSGIWTFLIELAEFGLQ